MIKDDVNLSVALNILDRKIANLNIQVVDNPDDIELKEKLTNLLNIKKEISKGNVELIKKVINSDKTNKNDWFKK